MTRHFDRWGGSSPWGAFIGRADNVPEWETEIDTMMLFAADRIGFARDQVQSQFSLTKQVDVTLDVIPAGAGKIKISTITPASLPWTGIYFDGVPVSITAIANPGYEFKYWEANSNFAINDPAANITVNIDTTDIFKAHFNQLELDVDVFPNPFSNMITINYQLPESMQVSLKLYSIMGQQVAEILSPDSFQTEGSKSVQFDADGLSLAQGLYVIEFKTRDQTKIIKLVRSKGN
ncbi:MAG: T9SS type A sorting domain-containing protein [Bacteroidetes bacterium]|nr:T9SS type A sorting domain-containing protein [Bacteroidota bacterium]